MITPAEALEKIFENLHPLPEELLPLLEAVDSVLAREMAAPEDLPPFDNSAMDGYAVRAADLENASDSGPALLRVRETVAAGGHSKRRLEAGETIRIMTGAPLPEGADAVVMQEMVSADGDEGIAVRHRPKPGEHVRRRGEDVRAGSLLLPRGTLLRPYELALLGAEGVTEVPVVRKPRVAVVATGDELVSIGHPLAPGKIRNSNSLAVSAALAKWGIPVIDFGVVRDEPGLIAARFREALVNADVLLVSGGVSVGEFDYTRAAFHEIGVREVFWKVSIKPGKPLVFGVIPGENKAVFGLPGNPVSVLVCLEEFVRPALERMRGKSSRHPSYHLVGTAANEYAKPSDRQQYLFCQVSGNGGGFQIRILRPQGSHRMGMAAQANALAVAPAGVSRIQAGDRLAFRWLK